ncbi:hypothetical protein DID98_22025 [Burkholderia sp. Bp8984]|nr:hypothetical protein DID98_22025 [Burkholderia sp. Bp8984]
MRAMRYRHSRRRRIAPRRRVNRFTGFISEPPGRFVSQRICVRVRHTAIQNRGGNGCSRSAARDARDTSRHHYRPAFSRRATLTRDATAGTRRALRGRTVPAPPKPRSARPCRLR